MSPSGCVVCLARSTPRRYASDFLHASELMKAAILASLTSSVIVLDREVGSLPSMRTGCGLRAHRNVGQCGCPLPRGLATSGSHEHIPYGRDPSRHRGGARRVMPRIYVGVRELPAGRTALAGCGGMLVEVPRESGFIFPILKLSSYIIVGNETINALYQTILFLSLST